MLELRDIDAGYSRLKVLHDVCIKVESGKIVVLIGPNGAGKSTVIKSIFSIADITKGKIFFKNKDITDMKTHELVDIGICMVTQGRANFNSLTIEENLLIGADRIDNKKIIDMKLDKVYHKFPVLKKKSKQRAYILSGGEHQLLALGRSLMQSPSILILDEPSLGLSPKLQKELFKTISELKEEGISILMVEQNAKKAISIADMTYLLEDGRIVLKGGKNILKNKKIKKVYLGGR
ncbi:ABC transporter ATP-binding protein [Candidatus Woesearchaeota archaeon]|nr:ABC transporter ATP-binding protein [Candidatus Woesearchaeota archaeon]